MAETTRKAPTTGLDAAIEALARAQHGAFSRSQALELGASRGLIERRLRATRWTRSGSGVYRLPGWERTMKQRVMVATLQAGAGAYASHRCAACLRELDGVTMAGIEITVPRRLRSMPRGVRVHVSDDASGATFDLVDRIPTASATEIVLALAMDASIAFTTVERVFECAQRRGETSHAALRARLREIARPGKPGVVNARRVLAALVDDGAVNHSDLETRFFQVLRTAGLPLPQRQRVVCRADGRFAHADYGYPGTPGLIELLGFRWHSTSEALTSDVERANGVALADNRTVSFTWDHVTKRRDYVIETMHRFLRHIRVEDRGQNAQE